MNNELHPSAFIKETLSDDGLLRGHIAKHGAPGHDVLDELLSACVIEAAFLLQPRDRDLHLGTRVDATETNSGTTLRGRTQCAVRVERAFRPASKPVIFLILSRL